MGRPMARIRTLKPEFWPDEKLAPLDPIHRLVFLGLISQADDAGRLVDSVRLLNGLLFPCTEDDCGESLETLARLSRIVRYWSESGQRLIQVANWTRHQRVDNPSKYNLPGPTPEDLELQGLTDPSLEPRESLARTARDPSVPIIDPIPSTTTSSPRRTSRKVGDYDERFSLFWNAYPRGKNENKKSTHRCWIARLNAGATAEEMIAGAERYTTFIDATGRYALNASTFLGPDDHWKLPWVVTEALTTEEPEPPADPKFTKSFEPVLHERPKKEGPEGVGGMAAKLLKRAQAQMENPEAP